MDPLRGSPWAPTNIPLPRDPSIARKRRSRTLTTSVLVLPSRLVSMKERAKDFGQGIDRGTASAPTVISFFFDLLSIALSFTATSPVRRLSRRSIYRYGIPFFLHDPSAMPSSKKSNCFVITTSVLVFPNRLDVNEGASERFRSKSRSKRCIALTTIIFLFGFLSIAFSLTADSPIRESMLMYIIDLPFFILRLFHTTSTTSAKPSGEGRVVSPYSSWMIVE